MTPLTALLSSLRDTQTPAEQRLREVVFARGVPAVEVHLGALDFVLTRVAQIPWPPDDGPHRELCTEVIAAHTAWLEMRGNISALVAKVPEIDAMNVACNQRFATLLQQRSHFDLRFSVALEHATEQAHEACRAAALIRIVSRFRQPRDPEALALGKQVLFLLNTQCSLRERELLCAHVAARLAALMAPREGLLGLLQARSRGEGDLLERSRELLEEALY